MERPAKIADKGKGQASSQPKAADVIKRAAQNAEQSDRRNEPQADQGRASSSKDSKIKQEKHSASGRNHRILEVHQAVWQQKPSDSVVSTARQRRPSDTRRDGMSRSSSTSHLGERRWEAGGQKEIPVLVGGGGPDDSSSQQQKPERIGTRGHGTDNIEAVTGERFKYKLGQSLTGIYSGGTTSGPAERIGTRGHGTDNIEAVTGERFKYKLGQQDGGVYDKSNN